MQIFRYLPGNFNSESLGWGPQATIFSNDQEDWKKSGLGDPFRSLQSHAQRVQGPLNVEEEPQTLWLETHPPCCFSEAFAPCSSAGQRWGSVELLSVQRVAGQGSWILQEHSPALPLTRTISVIAPSCWPCSHSTQLQAQSKRTSGPRVAGAPSLFSHLSSDARKVVRCRIVFMKLLGLWVIPKFEMGLEAAQALHRQRCNCQLNYL